jgi:putative ABC transport system permease protein
MSFEMLRMAVEALMANKIRTMLSMLGIIIGVSTVIAVVGIGEGAQQDIEEQYKNLSVTSIIVMGNMGRSATTTSKISAEDVNAIMMNEQYIDTATASVSGDLSVSYGKESSQYTILGALPNQFEVSNLNLALGEIFTEEDNNDRARVAVLGSTILDDLFDGDSKSAIGESITVGTKSLEVIGVLEKTGSTMGQFLSYDNSIYVPYSTAEKSLLGTSKRIMLTVLADNIDVIDLAFDELTEILRDAHNLRDDKEDDFRLMNAGSVIGAAQSTASTMTILLTSVAAIVLLVSGVGIMNVMFVTVAERTKEIGVAKAIGGKQSDILMQFLLESMILSIVGGLIGIALGQAILPLIEKFAHMSVAASLWGVILAFSFSVIVGIFFGFYPALKASKLDPVDALRSE